MLPRGSDDPYSTYCIGRNTGGGHDDDDDDDDLIGKLEVTYIQTVWMLSSGEQKLIWSQSINKKCRPMLLPINTPQSLGFAVDSSSSNLGTVHLRWSSVTINRIESTNLRRKWPCHLHVIHI